MLFTRFHARLRAALRPVGPVALLLALVVTQGLAVAPASAAQVSPVAGELRMLAAKAPAKSTVRIIVGVRAAVVPEGTLADSTAVENQRRGIAQAQQTLLKRLTGKNARLVARFQFIPYLSLEVDAATLTALASDANVTAVQEDIPVPPALKESIPLIGGNANGAFGTALRTGLGQTVAILDTGVMKTHAFLTGKVVSEACYSTTDAGQSSTAVCTPNSTAPGSGVNCSTSVEGCDHGTHVGGIVAGKAYAGQPNGPFNGVAKDAKLIAIQVFSKFTGANCGGFPNPDPCVLTYNTDQIKGLERVYALRNTYKIAAANMSLGGSQHFTHCDNDSRKAIIDQLASVGIATVIASGNEGFTNSVGAPACISTAVTVGSTTKQDTVSSFSNSASMVDILAPGSDITSSVTSGTNAFESFNGTSMATPHVAGAWAVIKQHKPTATVAEVLTALRNTGKSVTDSKNGLTKKRIQLTAAVNSIPTTANPVPVLSSITPSTVEAGYPAFTLTVTGSKFVPTSVVRWKGASRPTTYVSATQLKATISKTDIAAAGTAAVTVFSPTPGGGTSASKTFTITAPKTAPKPAITSLSPASRAAGTAAFTLIVKGTGFVPRSVVRWAGASRTTTYVSATELRATIAAADITAQGVKAVTVFTSTPGGGTSNSANFTVTAPPATPCNIDEPNNAVGASAKAIPIGIARTYAICTVGDKDYIAITGKAGDVYMVGGYSVSDDLDLVIERFNSGGSELDEVDDGGYGGDETIMVPFTGSGTYTQYVAFSSYYAEAGAAFTYKFFVVRDTTGS